MNLLSRAAFFEAMRGVRIHLVDPPATDAESLRGCLTDQELQQARSFVFDHDARLWIGYRTALRRLLGHELGIPPAEVPLETSGSGKPTLATPHHNLFFNLSHTHLLAAIVVSQDGPVGIDLEPWSRAPTLIDCEKSFCHPAELETLPPTGDPRSHALLELWTAKEAFLKALGIGLGFPPQKLRISSREAESDSPLSGLSDLRLHRLSHPALVDHCLAVALPRSTATLEIQIHHHLTASTP